MVSIDVGFAPDEKSLLGFIDRAAAHWKETFSNIGVGIDAGITKVAKAAVEASAATGKKITEIEEDVHKKAVDAANRAAALKVKAEQDYVALKSKFVLQGLDATRQAIHEEEQEVKKSRDAITRATQENLGKDTVAVLKAERDKQNARLQGLRSVEKEITGARTFSEQLEKNVYEPIKHEAAKGGALTKILFGEVGALAKQLKQTESQVQAHEATIAAHAKEATEKIEAQEREHATKLKALEDQIANSKNAEAKKELEAVKLSIEQQIAEERKLTQAKAAEEALQLQHHRAELEKELSETKSEHAKAASEKSKEGGEFKSAGSTLMQGAVIGAAIEGTKKLIEMSGAAAAAESRLQAATGLTGEALERAGEDAEALGHQYKIGGDAGKDAMAAVGAFTHATGDALKQQTEDAIILAQKMGASTESAAKLLGKAGDPEVAGNLKKLGINLDANATTEQRAAAVHEAAMKAKAGIDAANDNATKNSKEIMMELEETTGKYASTLLNFVNPALKLIMPVLPEMLIVIAAITVAMNAQAIAAKGQAIWNGILTIATAAQTAATWAMNAAMAVNPFVWIGLAVVALIAGIVLLVKHWQEVIAWFKKAAETVLNAGGALMDFLGITGKAEAATRKHTEATKKDTEVVKEHKQSVQEISDAYSKWTSEIGKNQDAEMKSAKQQQDDANHAIVDIRRQMRSATGEKRAALEEQLKLNIEAGKRGVAAQEAFEKEQHDAALMTGSAADKDAKDKSAKIDKDAYTEAKKAEDLRADLDKLDLERRLSAKTVSAVQYNKKLEDIETQHVANLKEIASQHRKGHETDAIKAETDLLKLQIAAGKKKEEQAIADNSIATENEIAALELRGAKEGLTEKKIAQQKFVIQQDGLLREIALMQDGTEKKSKLQMTYSINIAKHAAESAKESMQIENSLQKDALDSMRDGLDKKLALIEFERKRELENADLTEQQKSAILRKYRKQETDAFTEDQKQKQVVTRDFLQKGLDMTVGTWGERVQKIEEFLFAELKNLAINEGAKLIVSATAQNAQTAMTEAGFIARQAFHIAEGIASAASAAGKWIATAATAAYNAFETLPWPLDAVAAVASVAGVALLASQVPKLFGMADGGFVGGVGGERDDKNPRSLSRTEFVVNGKQAPKWAPVLHAINNGADPIFGGSGGDRVIHLDESQLRRLEKPTVMSSQRMLLDNRRAQQQRARILV